MSHRSRRKATNRARKVPPAWIACWVFILVGMALYMLFARHFTYYDGALHDKLVTGAFLVLLAVIAVARLARPMETPAGPQQSTLAAGLWFVVSTVVLAALLVLSANGYLALASAMTGETVTVDAKVCCGRESAPTQDTMCEYFISIIYEGRKSTECLDGFEEPRDIADGDIKMTIRRSSIGYNIDAIAFPPPPPPK